MFFCFNVMLLVYMYFIRFFKMFDEMFFRWYLVFFWENRLFERIFFNIGDVVVMSGLWIVNCVLFFLFFNKVVVNFDFWNILYSCEIILLWCLLCWFLCFFWYMFCRELMLYFLVNFFRECSNFLFWGNLVWYRKLWKVLIIFVE